MRGFIPAMHDAAMMNFGLYFGQVAQSAEEVVRAIGVGERRKKLRRIYTLKHSSISYIPVDTYTRFHHAKDCDTHDPAVGQ